LNACPGIENAAMNQQNNEYSKKEPAKLLFFILTQQFDK